MSPVAGILIFEIDCGRENLITQREHRDAGFEPTRAPEQMAGHGFGRAHRNLSIAKEISYRMRLKRIADGRRGAVRVDVTNVRGIDLGIANRIAHYAEAAFVLRRRLRDVVGVSRHAVADDFRDGLAPRRVHTPVLRESEFPHLRR